MPRNKASKTACSVDATSCRSVEAGEASTSQAPAQEETPVMVLEDLGSLEVIGTPPSFYLPFHLFHLFRHLALHRLLHQPPPTPTRPPTEEEEEEETDDDPCTQGGRRKKPLHLEPEVERELGEWLQENPFLYDRGLTEYKNTAKKERAMKEKAASFNLSAADLRKWIHPYNADPLRKTHDQMPLYIAQAEGSSS